MLRVPGDAVQHVVGRVVQLLRLRAQPGQLDPADHLAAGRIDARDARGEPYVREDFALHPFQLVDVLQRLAVCRHVDPTGLLERVGIEDADHRRAVAHVEPLAVAGERPAFAGIGEARLWLQRGEVVDETHVVLPAELDQPVLPHRDAFAVGRPGRGRLLQHLAGREVHLAHAGAADLAGALVEVAVQIEQAFGIGPGIVRVAVHHAVAVDRDAVLRMQRGDQREGERGEGDENLHAGMIPCGSAGRHHLS